MKVHLCLLAAALIVPDPLCVSALKDNVSSKNGDGDDSAKNSEGGPATLRGSEKDEGVGGRRSLMAEQSRKFIERAHREQEHSERHESFEITDELGAKYEAQNFKAKTVEKRVHLKRATDKGRNLVSDDDEAGAFESSSMIESVKCFAGNPATVYVNFTQAIDPEMIDLLFPEGSTVMIEESIFGACDLGASVMGPKLRENLMLRQARDGYLSVNTAYATDDGHMATIVGTPGSWFSQFDYYRVDMTHIGVANEGRRLVGTCGGHGAFQFGTSSGGLVSDFLGELKAKAQGDACDSLAEWSGFDVGEFCAAFMTFDLDVCVDINETGIHRVSIEYNGNIFDPLDFKFEVDIEMDLQAEATFSMTFLSTLDDDEDWEDDDGLEVGTTRNLFERLIATIPAPYLAVAETIDEVVGGHDDPPAGLGLYAILDFEVAGIHRLNQDMVYWLTIGYETGLKRTRHTLTQDGGYSRTLKEIEGRGAYFTVGQSDDSNLELSDELWVGVRPSLALMSRTLFAEVGIQIGLNAEMYYRGSSRDRLPAVTTGWRNENCQVPHQFELGMDFEVRNLEVNMELFIDLLKFTDFDDIQPDTVTITLIEQLVDINLMTFCSQPSEPANMEAFKNFDPVLAISQLEWCLDQEWHPTVERSGFVINQASAGCLTVHCHEASQDDCKRDPQLYSVELDHCLPLHEDSIQIFEQLSSGHLKHRATRMCVQIYGSGNPQHFGWNRQHDIDNVEWEYYDIGLGACDANINLDLCGGPSQTVEWDAIPDQQVAMSRSSALRLLQRENNGSRDDAFETGYLKICFSQLSDVCLDLHGYQGLLVDGDFPSVTASKITSSTGFNLFYYHDDNWLFGMNHHVVHKANIQLEATANCLMMDDEGTVLMKPCRYGARDQQWSYFADGTLMNEFTGFSLNIEDGVVQGKYLDHGKVLLSTATEKDYELWPYPGTGWCNPSRTDGNGSICKGTSRSTHSATCQGSYTNGYFPSSWDLRRVKDRCDANPLCEGYTLAIDGNGNSRGAKLKDAITGINPRVGYAYRGRACVIGHNLPVVNLPEAPGGGCADYDAAVAECARICDENDECEGFEFPHKHEKLVRHGRHSCQCRPQYGNDWNSDCGIRWTLDYFERLSPPSSSTNQWQCFTKAPTYELVSKNGYCTPASYSGDLCRGTTRNSAATACAGAYSNGYHAATVCGRSCLEARCDAEPLCRGYTWNGNRGKLKATIEDTVRGDNRWHCYRKPDVALPSHPQIESATWTKVKVYPEVASTKLLPYEYFALRFDNRDTNLCIESNSMEGPFNAQDCSPIPNQKFKFTRNDCAMKNCEDQACCERVSGSVQNSLVINTAFDETGRLPGGCYRDGIGNYNTDEVIWRPVNEAYGPVDWYNRAVIPLRENGDPTCDTETYRWRVGELTCDREIRYEGIFSGARGTGGQALLGDCITTQNTDGTGVWLHYEPCQGGANQLFRYYSSGEIVNLHSGLCIIAEHYLYDRGFDDDSWPLATSYRPMLGPCKRDRQLSLWDGGINSGSSHQLQFYNRGTVVPGQLNYYLATPLFTNPETPSGIVGMNKADPGTTGMFTVLDELCYCFTEACCEAAALTMGLDFASRSTSSAVKGCYAYKSGSEEGNAYWNDGGDTVDMATSQYMTVDMYRLRSFTKASGYPRTVYVDQVERSFCVGTENRAMPSDSFLSHSAVRP